MIKETELKSIVAKIILQAKFANEVEKAKEEGINEIKYILKQNMIDVLRDITKIICTPIQDEIKILEEKQDKDIDNLIHDAKINTLKLALNTISDSHTHYYAKIIKGEI